MTKPVVIDAIAEEEISDALVSAKAWGAKTEAKFQESIDEVWTLLEANPALGAKVPRSPYRLYPMVGFPYYAVYREDPDRIVVLVFGHTSRHPNYWKKRLRKP
jgi:plasmid stabilization system protein ParE